jgi:hypothetical protein
MKLVLNCLVVWLNEISGMGVKLIRIKCMWNHITLRDYQYGLEYQRSVSLFPIFSRMKLEMRLPWRLTAIWPACAYGEWGLVSREHRRDIDLATIWCQQDGYIARPSVDTFRTMFDHRIISLCGNISWQARSPDLSACYFFFWGGGGLLLRKQRA